MKKLIAVLVILSVLGFADISEAQGLRGFFRGMFRGIFGGGSVKVETVSGCGDQGHTTSTATSSTANYAASTIFTNTSACLVNKVYYYDPGNTNGTLIKVGLYASTGTAPTGDVIVASDAITMTAVAGVKSANIAETELNASTTYHLVVIANGSFGYASTEAAGGHYMAWNGTNYPTFPTWSGSTSAGLIYRMYIGYE